MTAISDMIRPLKAQASHTRPCNLLLMAALYFPEFSLKLIEWAKTLVRIAFPEVNDTIRLTFPAYDSDGLAIVVSELSVNFAHNAFTLRLKTPTIAVARLWLHETHLPHTMRSYRNSAAPVTGRIRSCGNLRFTIKLLMRIISPYTLIYLPRRPELHTRGRHSFLADKRHGKVTLNAPAISP